MALASPLPSLPSRDSAHLPGRRSGGCGAPHHPRGGLLPGVSVLPARPARARERHAPLRQDPGQPARHQAQRARLAHGRLEEHGAALCSLQPAGPPRFPLSLVGWHGTPPPPPGPGPVYLTLCFSVRVAWRAPCVPSSLFATSARFVFLLPCCPLSPLSPVAPSVEIGRTDLLTFCPPRPLIYPFLHDLSPLPAVTSLVLLWPLLHRTCPYWSSGRYRF